MSENVDQVLAVSARLREVHERITELDRERAELQAEMERCMTALSAATGERFLPLPAHAKRRDQIVAIFRRNPEQRLSALDLAGMLNLRQRRELGALRMLLARMTTEGILVRVRHGLYG